MQGQIMVTQNLSLSINSYASWKLKSVSGSTNYRVSINW